MQQCDSIAELRQRLVAVRAGGRPVAFVPTMGALHAGHLRLVDVARGTGACVVLSIFVNPLQFAPGEDLARYPRDLDRDRALASARGVDLLFTPSVEEMYPHGAEIRVAAGPAATRWEGAVRPGHFDGVLTVVAKLFHIVEPDTACFGQKDIQQFALIRQMVKDLDFDIELVLVPTVRDDDGLALSSRNQYLTPADRAAALALPKALHQALARWRAGERGASVLQTVVADQLGQSGLPAADYIAVADPHTLSPVERAAPGTVVALAVRVGGTRLIDNIILREVGD